MSEETIVSDDNSAVSDSEATKYDEAAFRKLLNQRKADKQKAEELSLKLKEVEEKLNLFTKKELDLQEQKLQEQGNYKALLKQREDELARVAKEKSEVEGKLNSFQKDFIDMKKMSTFFEKLGGNLVDKEYLSLVDTDRIALDPDTGAIDEKSINSYVKEFTSKHSRIINFKSGKLPNEAGSGSGKSMSYEEWKALAQTNPAEARKKMHLIKSS